MKVGDYVRTNKGIAKYLGLGKDVLSDEIDKNSYEYYYNQHLFNNYIFDVGHDYGDTLTDNEFNNIDKLGKVKEKIIDLIEVEDYVNGEKVIRLFNPTFLSMGELPYVITDKNKYEPQEIENVVTKEQFSQMEYKVGEQ